VIDTFAGSPANTTASHTYADGPSTQTHTVTVTDEDGDFFAGSLDVVVMNVAPTATLSNNGPINEGGSASVSFTNGSDPSSADAGSLRYFLSTSQGARDAATYATATTVTSASFAFSDDGSYPVYGRVLDKDGGYTDYQTNVVVKNVAPSLHVSGATTVNEGSAYTLILSASDPGADTIDHWTINWGDGSALQTLAGNPSSVTHT
jgi:hypothetical protein